MRGVSFPPMECKGTALSPVAIRRAMTVKFTIMIMTS